MSSWPFWARGRLARPRSQGRSPKAITRNRIISTWRTRRSSPEFREVANLALKDLKGLIIIDEVQRAPDLFPLLRALSDRRPRPARFLVLGSASPDLLRQSSESLAGRISYYELNGLGLELVMEQLAATGREFYHWRTHTGAELDLYARMGSERLGIEVKLSSAPAVTSSMRNALRDLKLDELIVVHAGDSSYPLADRIRAVSAHRLLTSL